MMLNHKNSITNVHQNSQLNANKSILHDDIFTSTANIFLLKDDLLKIETKSIFINIICLTGLNLFVEY